MHLLNKQVNLWALIQVLFLKIYLIYSYFCIFASLGLFTAAHGLSHVAEIGDFPGGSDGKESACKLGDPGLGRSPGEGNGNPLQYSCLENFMDRGVWWATVHGVAKRQTQLSD